MPELTRRASGSENAGVSPLPVVRFCHDTVVAQDLEEIIGTRTRIAEVLSRKRGLPIAMIRRLHERLGISAEVLIRPSRKSVA